jgi:hypothetical protein
MHAFGAISAMINYDEVSNKLSVVTAPDDERILQVR